MKQIGDVVIFKPGARDAMGNKIGLLKGRVTDIDGMNITVTIDATGNEVLLLDVTNEYEEEIT